MSTYVFVKPAFSFVNTESPVRRSGARRRLVACDSGRRSSSRARRQPGSGYRPRWGRARPPAAPAAEPEARAFFDGLSYSNRRWFVLSIDGAKTPETRQRRVDRAVEMLRERRQPRLRAARSPPV